MAPPPFSSFLFQSPILFFLISLPFAFSCSPSDHQLIAQAFRYVSGFHLPPHAAYNSGDCSVIVPNRNLTGTVSWSYLRSVADLRVLDLSGNALQGSVPSDFWSATALVEVNLAANRLGGALRFGFPLGQSPSLRSLNLSCNRFTSVTGLDALPLLELLDLSRNSLGLLPLGLENLRRLRHLDLSSNNINWVFPSGFPPLRAELSYLNISYNNFTGVVLPEVVEMFGKSAFVNAGSLQFDSFAQVVRPSSPASLAAHQKNLKRKRRNRKIKIWLLAGAVSLVFIASCCIVCLVMKRRKGRKDDNKWWEKELESTAAPSQEAKWVVEAKMSARVVLFEKPLMELTFADLVKATSGFGEESQLADGGPRGPAYRAVLPGDMHMVIRVVESARHVEERAAAASFRELGRLRHPNLLPLLGYCIPGKEKLAMYQYMERGNLHRWLHELPVGQPNVEDWSGDTWEKIGGEDKPVASAVAAESGAMDWPTRHRIALGIARGLAFLHQGWLGSTLGVVHGHLTPSNILLGDDLEPRVADFGDAGGGTAEGDVYDFGVVVMELVTGRNGWSGKAVSWARELVRAGRGVEGIDPRLQVVGLEVEREMVECLSVGYLCTAPSSEKRPSMQQVVGLLKDIRRSSSSCPATVAPAPAHLPLEI